MRFPRYSAGKVHSSSPTSSRREVLRRSSRACARLLSFPREAIASSRRIGRSSLCPAIKPAVKKKKGGKRGGKRREKGRKIERVHLLARTVKTAVLQAPAYRGRSSRCFPFAAPFPSAGNRDSSLARCQGCINSLSLFLSRLFAFFSSLPLLRSGAYASRLSLLSSSYSSAAAAAVASGFFPYSTRASNPPREIFTITRCGRGESKVLLQ